MGSFKGLSNMMVCDVCVVPAKISIHTGNDEDRRTYQITISVRMMCDQRFSRMRRELSLSSAGPDLHPAASF